MEKYKVKVGTISEFEHHEFHITPCLTYGWDKVDDGNAYGIAIEWGFWAFVIALYIAKIN